MLILFAPGRDPVPVQTQALPIRRCDFIEQRSAYTARRIEPRLQEAFEQHLIQCAPCQRAVHLGRISTQLNHHNRSVGMACAAQTRRKS